MTIEANISRVAGWSAKLSFFAALSLSLAACGGESLSDTLGYGKSAPDEFAIVTKAPLVIPPDYSLRPPQPGAPRPQEMELQPSIGAQRALIGAEALSAENVGPARKRYLQFLVIVRQLTEEKVSPSTFRDEFLDFTYAVAGKLDFGIYSFCLDRIFGNIRIPQKAKHFLVEEIVKYPPLIRRELLTNILVTNAQQIELGEFVRSAIRGELDENVAMEIHLLEQIKQSRISVGQIESLLAGRGGLAPSA